VKKRFGFSLDEELHAALQARADEEGVSMAAICREALFAHLQKPALDLSFPPRPTIAGPDWVDTQDDIFQELDDFLSEPFRPEHTPDLLYRADRPRRKRCLYDSPPERRGVVDCSHTRWLDELWA
jgi:hypothetical protein